MKRLMGYTAVLCLVALTIGCGGTTNTGTLAYVSNSTGSSFTVFTVNNNGTLSTSSISPQNTPASPKILQFSPNGKWAYFLDDAGLNIYAYTRSGNGSLGDQIAVIPVTGAASSLAVSPNSETLYVALPFAIHGELAYYGIDSTGKPSGNTPLQTGLAVTQLVMAPGGGVLYGLSPTQQTLVSWSLSPSGVPTQSSTISMGLDPVYMVLSANGAYMYVLDHTGVTNNVPNVATGGLPGPSPNIYGFAVPPGGVLLQSDNMAGSPFTENADLKSGIFPSGPIAGSTSGDSRFLYVANQGSGNVSVFEIESPNGTPTEVLGSLSSINGSTVSTASPFACGCSPSFLAVAASNNALFLLDPVANQIFQDAIDQSTGQLRALNPASVPLAAGSGPTWITIR